MDPRPILSANTDADDAANTWGGYTLTVIFTANGSKLILVAR